MTNVENFRRAGQGMVRAVAIAVDKVLADNGISVPEGTTLDEKITLLGPAIGLPPDQDDELEEAIDLLHKWMDAVDEVYPDIADIRSETEAFLRGRP